MTPATIARASAWAAAGTAGSKAVSLATTVALARLLGPVDFGVVALAAVVTDVVLLVQDLGLSPALVQFRGDAAAAAAAAIRLHAIAAALLFAAVELAADPIAAALGDPAIAPLVRALAVGTLLRAVGLVPRALLQRRMAFRALAGVDVAGLVARAAVAIALAWRGAGPWSLVAGDLGSLLVQGAGAWLACGRVPLAASRDGGVRTALLAFGRTMTVASLVTWARDGLSRLLVGVLLGPAELGYFQMATRVASLPVTGISHVSNRVTLPVYAATHERAALGDRYLVTVFWVSALVLPLCAILIATAPAAVAVAFGPAWAPVVAPLRILLAANMASAIAATSGELFKALGRPGALLRTSVPHLVLLAAALPVGAAHGLVGVATALALVRTAIAALALGIALRLLAMPPAALLGAVAPALAGTATSVTALAVLGGVGLAPSGTSPAALALRTALAAGAYAVGFLAVRGGRAPLIARPRRRSPA